MFKDNMKVKLLASRLGPWHVVMFGEIITFWGSTTAGIKKQNPGRGYGLVVKNLPCMCDALGSQLLALLKNHLIPVYQVWFQKFLGHTWWYTGLTPVTQVHRTYSWYSGTQGLLLAMCSGITPGIAQESRYGARQDVDWLHAGQASYL